MTIKLNDILIVLTLKVKTYELSIDNIVIGYYSNAVLDIEWKKNRHTDIWNDIGYHMSIHINISIITLNY